jgi:hypothetical protein
MTGQEEKNAEKERKEITKRPRAKKKEKKWPRAKTGKPGKKRKLKKEWAIDFSQPID